MILSAAGELVRELNPNWWSKAQKCEYELEKKYIEMQKEADKDGQTIIHIYNNCDGGFFSYRPLAKCFLYFFPWAKEEN